MTDSILLFPAGFRVLDANGDPVSGAQVRFFGAGTTTPKNVYSDSTLITSLGSIVYTRSDGYLVASQGSNTTVAVYTGSGLYKVDILDANSVTLYPAKDNVQGAVDTSAFLTSSATSTLVIPVTAIATDTTLTTTHKGSLIHSSGAITLTLDNPATLTNGWSVKIRCNDTTNATKIVASSGTIKGPGFSVAALALSGLGAEIELVCDGGNIIVANKMLGLPLANGRLWTLASRVSSAPATTPGSWYLVSAGFGAFSTDDIIEATGQATFIGYTPPANSGWLAYVQADNAFYKHRTGGWLQTVPAILNTVQRFTSGSGTYTPAANVTRIKVRMCAGGGGGAAAITNNGNVGGDSTFLGGSWTAKGGSAGLIGSGGDGGLGGAGGTGGVNGAGNLVDRKPGGAGFAGMGTPGGNQAVPGGSGGANPFGGGGPGGAGANSASAVGLAGATNSGAGGGGAGIFGTSPATSSGGGGAGEYVEFWTSNPGAVSYAVGAGGNGGAAGTRAGGNGAAGIITIEEYYD